MTKSIFDPIGGYFELETQARADWLTSCQGLLLNSARNAFRVVLEARRPRRVLIPRYLCHSMLQPLQETKTPFEPYQINHMLLPAEPLEPAANELAVVANYFGLRAGFEYDQDVSGASRFLIDNSQAFFSFPTTLAFSIYSPRKFFGVPDGGVLHGPGDFDPFLSGQSQSIERFGHLLGRAEFGPEKYYEASRSAEHSLAAEPPRPMSKVTRKLLASFDFAHVAKRRRANFELLHSALWEFNLLKPDLEKDAVPMVYPFLPKEPGLRDHLISRKIYVAKYWPKTVALISNGSFEHGLVHRLAPLPIDQRYGAAAMARIIETVNAWLSGKSDNYQPQAR